ncbi:MAG: hypothetical protein ACO35I_03855 [Burkholderiaceae bacterium]
MDAWLNLRRLIDITANETDFGQLEWVMHRYNPKDPLFVQSIVLDSRVASPATIHKCLALLDRTGFLSFQVDPADSRRRIVSPTSKAIKTFGVLSRRVAEWANNQAR